MNEIVWDISLGYDGPTDSCLILSNGKGDEKEYLIESLAWQLLSVFHNKTPIPKELAEWIWTNLDLDMRYD